MKKVLFTTTALVASAGMAAADINLSGSGRLGLVYIQNSAVGGQDVRIEKRMTINIDGSGSTDGGLEFGGRIRLRSDEGETGTSLAAGNVYIGNDTWKVTVGNTSGAVIYRVPFFSVGSIGLDGNGWSNIAFNIGSNRFYLDTYSSNGAAGAMDVVRLDFNVGDFGVSLSTSHTADRTKLGDAEENAIAASYNFGDWTVAAGYAANASGTNDSANIAITGSIGDIGVGIAYSDLENVGNKVTLSGSYTMGATTVTAFVANTSEDTAGSAGIPAVGGSDTEYGIGFTHSLGGATLVGGISRNYTETTYATLGVRFGF